MSIGFSSVLHYTEQKTEFVGLLHQNVRSKKIQELLGIPHKLALSVICV